VTLSAGMTQDVRLLDVNLTQCIDYSIRVVAVMGMEFSDEIEIIFNTCHVPDNNETVINVIDEGQECVKIEEECVDKTIIENNCISDDSDCVSATTSLLLQNIHNVYLSIGFYLLFT
jgi:hypothetical protein